MQATPAINRRRRERWFYISMSIAAVITVFAGFAPTYYLRPYFNSAPLMPLLHCTDWCLLHGWCFFWYRPHSSPRTAPIFIVVWEYSAE